MNKILSVSQPPIPDAERKLVALYSTFCKLRALLGEHLNLPETLDVLNRQEAREGLEDIKHYAGEVLAATGDDLDHGSVTSVTAQKALAGVSLEALEATLGQMLNDTVQSLTQLLGFFELFSRLPEPLGKTSALAGSLQTLLQTTASQRRTDA